MDQKNKIAFDMLRTIYRSANIKTGRSFEDFFADCIVQAVTETTLLAAYERLGKSVNIQMSEMYQPSVKDFLANVNNFESVLVWLRNYPKVAAMLASLKTKDYLEAIEGITIEDVDRKSGVAIKMPDSDIQIKLTCLSPFAHGADSKAGNATLFRRQDILCANNAMLSLPFYAGNALRGTIRDLLADHFISSLGLTPRRDAPPVALWFFHALYAGGALEETNTKTKAIIAKLGNNGSVKSGGIKEFRDMLPGLSLLGSAMGNKILAGRCNFNDFRPRCIEYDSGESSAAELFEWTYLTRREDHEDHIKHHGMIAHTECLKAGVIMDGGIDMSTHINELEKSSLGMGLQLAKQKGKLGAENRRGLGNVRIDISNHPDCTEYESYLKNNKSNIIKYLGEINAIASG